MREEALDVLNHMLPLFVLAAAVSLGAAVSAQPTQPPPTQPPPRSQPPLGSTDRPLSRVLVNPAPQPPFGAQLNRPIDFNAEGVPGGPRRPPFSAPNILVRP
jgi:hypothetical protein